MSRLTQILNVLLWIPRKLLLALNFSFGGLATGFYIRHLIFGVIVSVCVVVTSTLLLKFVLPLLSEPIPYIHQVTGILRFIVKESQPTPSFGIIFFYCALPLLTFCVWLCYELPTGITSNANAPKDDCDAWPYQDTALLVFNTFVRHAGLLTLFFINLSCARGSQHASIASQRPAS